MKNFEKEKVWLLKVNLFSPMVERDPLPTTTIAQNITSRLEKEVMAHGELSSG